MVRLSERLAAIAACVPPGASVIDVGTDHGLLPVWLVQSGRVSAAAASDLRPGPLAGARALAEETGTAEALRLCVCDGLDAFSADDGNCVVIAGMGGETMAEILRRAPWTRSGVTLLLQPQTKSELLRDWLWAAGYRITSERLLRDAGRLYQLLTVTGGADTPGAGAERYLGRRALIGRDPLLGEYIDGLLRRTQKAAPYDPAAAALLEELMEWRKDLP